VHQTHGNHHDAPEKHDCWQEDRGSEALEQDVGDGLETGVADEEETQRGVVLAVGHVEVLLEAVYLWDDQYARRQRLHPTATYFSVADVGTVCPSADILANAFASYLACRQLTQERHKIQESQPRNNHEVEAANKLLVLYISISHCPIHTPSHTA